MKIQVVGFYNIKKLFFFSFFKINQHLEYVLHILKNWQIINVLRIFIFYDRSSNVNDQKYVFKNNRIWNYTLIINIKLHIYKQMRDKHVLKYKYKILNWYVGTCKNILRNVWDENKFEILNNFVFSMKINYAPHTLYGYNLYSISPRTRPLCEWSQYLCYSNAPI